MTAERALARLSATLTSTADALASARLDALLDAEPALQAALAAVPAGPIDAGDAVGRARFVRDITEARAALVRCRRLGLSLGEFVRIALAAQGAPGAYDHGGRPQAPMAGRLAASLEARG